MNHEQFFYSKSKILKEILESYDDIRIAHIYAKPLCVIAKKQDEHRTSFFRINHPPDKILLYIYTKFSIIINIIEKKEQSCRRAARSRYMY